MLFCYRKIKIESSVMDVVIENSFSAVFTHLQQELRTFTFRDDQSLFQNRLLSVADKYPIHLNRISHLSGIALTSTYVL